MWCSKNVSRFSIETWDILDHTESSPGGSVLLFNGP
jgi:hypothetical protein